MRLFPDHRGCSGGGLTSVGRSSNNSALYDCLAALPSASKTPLKCLRNALHPTPPAPNPSGQGGLCVQSRLCRGQGGHDRGWGRDRARGRISLKRSWKGEPTWAAVGPDGVRSPALIKGQVSPRSVAIVGDSGLRGHLRRLSVGMGSRPSL